MTRLAKAAIVVVTAPLALLVLLWVAMFAALYWVLHTVWKAWEPVLDRFVQWVRGES